MAAARRLETAISACKHYSVIRPRAVTVAYVITIAIVVVGRPARRSRGRKIMARRRYGCVRFRRDLATIAESRRKRSGHATLYRILLSRV